MSPEIRLALFTRELLASHAQLTQALALSEELRIAEMEATIQALKERDTLSASLAAAQAEIERQKALVLRQTQLGAEAMAENERLREINSSLVRDHNYLLADGARWQSRAEKAEAENTRLQELRAWTLTSGVYAHWNGAAMGWVKVSDVLDEIDKVLDPAPLPKEPTTP